tara:strand:+ start:189 stop:431 length:243 start_codon:yes stop_codon:yes gene_type:complete
MLPKRKDFKWNEDSSLFLDHSSKRNTIYIDSTGKNRTIKEMDTNHIKNVLNKINRTENWKNNFKVLLEIELIYRQVYNLK